MRRTILFAAAALLTTACVDQPSAPSASAGDALPTALQRGGAANLQEADFVPGRLLVRFAPGTASGPAAAAVGGSVDRVLSTGVHVLSVPVGAEARVQAALDRNPNVVFVEPDLIRTTGDPTVIPVNDPFIGYKWDLDNDGNIYTSAGVIEMPTGAADADMDWLEAYTALGSSVTGSARIGIMDTGILHDHQDLVGRVAAEYDFFAGDADAADDNGHGTHVAGITAAATGNGTGVAGVAFGSNIDFVITKVCGQSRGGGPRGGYGCPSSAIAEGIRFAVDNGAHVLNLSLGGGGGSTTTREALQYARANNVLPICAAGNDAGPVSFPGAWPECVAVSSTDWGDDIASYSNTGPEVELSAPGGDFEDPSGRSQILSSYFDSPTSYAFLAGTSMASPQVAGLGALLHALGVADDDAKLARMQATADDLGAPNTDDQYGAGRINVFAATNGLGGGGGGGGGGTNAAPTAALSVDCTELTCSFDGTGSSDSDGSVVSWTWDFGDGASASGSTATHSYAAAGDYTVTLSVTDNEGAGDVATATATATDPAPPPPPADDITLSASAGKRRGVHVVTLSWGGATGSNVVIYRDGGIIATTANDGEYQDNTGNKGGATYVYQVCETDNSVCSATVTVVY